MMTDKTNEELAYEAALADVEAKREALAAKLREHEAAAREALRMAEAALARVTGKPAKKRQGGGVRGKARGSLMPDGYSERALQYLQTAGAPVRQRDICIALGVDAPRLSAHLLSLIRRGAVTRPSRGVYQAVAS